MTEPVIEPNQLWVSRNGKYTMAVTDVREGTVSWNGVYDRDYQTPIERFREWIASGEDGWKLAGSER